MSKKNLNFIMIILFGGLVFFSKINSDISFDKYLMNFAIVPLLYCIMIAFKKQSSMETSYIIAFSIGVFITVFPVFEKVTINLLYETIPIIMGSATAFILGYIYKKLDTK